LNPKDETMTQLDEKLLLNIHELAELTGLKVGSLYHWAAEGKVPCVRLSARCLRFRRESIIDWLGQLEQRDSNSKAEFAKRKMRPNRNTKTD
jgi:predicted DNA-binding transcriptional regulator AlpA